jgi:serine/threonine-protein kinase
MGTVSYMSPEQAQGLRVDERTDLWSTGIVIYEMVAGRLPFAGTTSSHLIVEILEKEPALFGETGIVVPPELERIVAKASGGELACAGGHRSFRTPAQLLDDGTEISRWPTVRSTLPTRRRNQF